MKKKLFLFAALGTAILSAVSIIQFNADSCDGLLHANVEALAGPGGDVGQIPCLPMKLYECTFSAKDAIGQDIEITLSNMIYVAPPQN